MCATEIAPPAPAGDRRALARALRVVEDRRRGWQDILAASWPRSGSAHLVGITGAPGSGKSTLTGSLISSWRADLRRVAVIAVDPSSPVTGGALMGDRLRMQGHTSDPEVFVRSMASRGRLGGLADTTGALVTVLDAAGFDPVVLETVGVGQAEVEVTDHVDTVVVVLNPGWGDGVQAAKAGILEVGDIFVINKADRPDAPATRALLVAMLEMGPDRPWSPPVIETVATQGSGVDDLAAAIDGHRRHLVETGQGEARQRARARSLVEGAVLARLMEELSRPGVDGVLGEVAARRLDPWTAAGRLVD